MNIVALENASAGNNEINQMEIVAVRESIRFYIL